MKCTIWFDMDGTLNKFYDVPNWLAKLEAGDTSPYTEAKAFLNLSQLSRYLTKLQKLGYHIGIISWLSKNATPAYNKAVTKAKRDWLKTHLKSVQFDEIHIVKYGTPKYKFMHSNMDILFDDEEKNRSEWYGYAYCPNEIIETLKDLIEWD